MRTGDAEAGPGGPEGLSVRGRAVLGRGTRMAGRAAAPAGRAGTARRTARGGSCHADARARAAGSPASAAAGAIAESLVIYATCDLCYISIRN